MPPDLMLAYVDEFLRVLRPGGVACFDIPPGYARTLRGTLTRVAPAPLLRWYRERQHHDAVMELHCIAPPRVEEHLERRGATVIESRPLPEPAYAVTARHQYIVQRPAPEAS
jgi:SAM-dependent methyltransferase